MILGLDYYNNMEVPSFVLCKPNGERINTIPCTAKNGTIKFNDYDEISFTTYLYIDGEKNEVYEKINELMHLELPDIGRYVITEVTINSEGTDFEYKECTALSEEVLMAQKYLELFVINKGTVESVEQANNSDSSDETESLSVNNVQFYNPNNPDKSLLHLILNEKCPDWGIGHVDNELMVLERSFNIDRQDIYSFLTNEVSEAFECIFVFDTLKHLVNAYVEKTVGEDTDIHISYSNLAKNAQLSSSTDDIKTCLTVKGKDDLNIREVNMGNDRIVNIDYFHSLEYMSQGLYDAYAEWKKNWNEYAVLYEYLISGIIDESHIVKPNEGKVYDHNNKVWCYYSEDIEGVDLIKKDKPTNPQNFTWGYQRIYNKINYITSLMMPTNEDGELDESGEYKGKNVENVEQAIWDEYKTIFDEHAAFNDYVAWFSNYGLNPLKSKLQVYYKKRTLRMETYTADENVDESIHVELLKLAAAIRAISSEINSRQAEIDFWKEKQKQIGDQMNSLCTDLDLTNEVNFTKEQYKELIKFIREDELSSENFLTNSIDTESTRIDVIRELLKHGQEELAKVSVPTLQFSMDMLNIYATPEFKDNVDKFNVGNYMYVTLRDDFSLKVRLLTVDINFLDSNDFSIECGNVSRTRGNKLLQDVTEALKLSSDAATSVSYNASTWNKANVDATEISDMINSGLLNAGKSLKTTESDVIIDEFGITVSNNPTESNGEKLYPGDTIFLGGGQILFSDDNLRTVKTALGRVKYNRYNSDKKSYDEVSTFGLITDTVLSGYIGSSVMESSTIYGGEIYSINYEHDDNELNPFYSGTYINLKEGTFEFNGGGEQRLMLTKDSDNDYTLTVKGTIEADSGHIGGNDGFSIGVSGTNGYMYTGGKLDVDLKPSLKDGNGKYKGIYIGSNGIGLGYSDTSKKSLFSVTADGVLTAASGTIGGATITSDSISGSDSTGKTRWEIKKDGTAHFTNVYIGGVSAGSKFGGVSYTTDNNGNEYTQGNFNYGFEVTENALKDFNNLVVGTIAAENVLANYVTTSYLDAYQISADRIDTKNLTIGATQITGAIRVPIVYSASAKDIQYLDAAGTTQSLHVVTGITYKYIYVLGEENYE